VRQKEASNDSSSPLSIFAITLFATITEVTQIREFDRLSGDDQIRFVDGPGGDRQEQR